QPREAAEEGREGRRQGRGEGRQGRREVRQGRLGEERLGGRSTSGGGAPPPAPIPNTNSEARREKRSPAWLFRAPSRVRTDTGRILSPLPLPIGLWGLCVPRALPRADFRRRFGA